MKGEGRQFRNDAVRNLTESKLIDLHVPHRAFKLVPLQYILGIALDIDRTQEQAFLSLSQ